MSDFTTKQQAFIDNYIKTLNGTEAARRAKYKGNDNILASIASQNLRKLKVREEIDRRLRELSITDEEILFRLQKQATADMGDIVDKHGIINLERLKDVDTTAIIKKYKVTKAGREIELYDSQAALIHLFKLRRLLDNKPTVIIRLQRALDSGLIDLEQIKEKYPSLAEQFFSNVD